MMGRLDRLTDGELLTRTRREPEAFRRLLRPPRPHGHGTAGERDRRRRAGARPDGRGVHGRADGSQALRSGRAAGDEELERVEQILDAAGSGLAGALERLPALEQQAITARVLDERDYSDIAATERTSEAAIRQRVSRGLARLGRARQERRR